jgi:hypothetical protein
MGFPVVPDPFAFIHAAEQGMDSIGYGSGYGAWHDVHGIGYFRFGQQIARITLEHRRESE